MLAADFLTAFPAPINLKKMVEEQKRKLFCIGDSGYVRTYPIQGLIPPAPKMPWSNWEVLGRGKVTVTVSLL